MSSMLRYPAREHQLSPLYSCFHIIIKAAQPPLEKTWGHAKETWSSFNSVSWANISTFKRKKKRARRSTEAPPTHRCGKSLCPLTSWARNEHLARHQSTPQSPKKGGRCQGAVRQCSIADVLSLEELPTPLQDWQGALGCRGRWFTIPRLPCILQPFRSPALFMLVWKFTIHCILAWDKHICFCFAVSTPQWIFKQLREISKGVRRAFYASDPHLLSFSNQLSLCIQCQKNTPNMLPEAT